MKKKKEITVSKSHSIFIKRRHISKKLYSPNTDTTMAHILASF